MKTLLDFDNTLDFFKYLDEIIKDDKQVDAGNLSEEYWCNWHRAKGDYANVYNTNVDPVPLTILEKINAVGLFALNSRNTFGIDKICITHSGDIDVHQDKSAKLSKKNASTALAKGMMSLSGTFTNVRNYVLNTTYEDTSRYYGVWNPLITIYKYADFVPSDDDETGLRFDKALWKGIKKGTSANIKKFGKFKPRGPAQTNYINDVETQLTKQLDDTGMAKGYAKGAGALGKSVLDSVIMAKLQNNKWTKELTNSPAPISVSFFHSSKTISDNGLTEINYRRSEGIHDRVIVVSGTKVVDDGYLIADSFEKSDKDLTKTVEKIVGAVNKGQSVLLLTLYHHAGTIELIKNLLTDEFPGFKFWARKRDECDWPCSNDYGSYAPALDHRTESVITFGSSGTDRFGDVVTDNGTNNEKHHGKKLHDFPWTQAEDAKLVKPLKLIIPVLIMSDILLRFPELCNNNDLDKTRYVMSNPVTSNGKDSYLTVNDVIKLVGIQKAMVANPKIKRTLMFAGRVYINQLVHDNWVDIADQHFEYKGKTAQLEMEIRNIHIEVINDQKYNANSLGEKHDLAIARAKSHERYIIGSCRVFNRGYDDKKPSGYTDKWPKHHASFHLSEKSETNTVQEIWRVTRLDNESTDKLAYYMCPIIINDVDHEAGPSWEEVNIETLRMILSKNKNIEEEFESQAKNRSSNNRTVNSPQLSFTLPAGMEIKTIGALFSNNNLYYDIEYGFNYRNDLIRSELVKEAHDWLTDEYCDLSEPRNKLQRGKLVHTPFLEISKFKPLYKDSCVDSREWCNRFFNDNLSGTYSKKTKAHMQVNIKRYNEYCNELAELAMEAHDLLTDEYLKLSEPTNDKLRGRHVHTPFLEISKFKPLHKSSKVDSGEWCTKFFNDNLSGTYSKKTKAHMQVNIKRYEEYCNELAELAMEAHDLLTDEYLKLGEPTNLSQKGQLVHTPFLKIDKFKPLHNDSHHLKKRGSWCRAFFNDNLSGTYSKKTKAHMQVNIKRYEEYCYNQ